MSIRILSRFTPKRVHLRPLYTSHPRYAQPLQNPQAPQPTQTPQDPYPLPLSDPSLIAETPHSTQTTTAPEEWPLPGPLDRTGEDEKTLRARLVYQTRKRGTLETDLLLATFARDHLGTMPMEEMKEFDKLLDEPDWDIYYWSIEKREPPPRWKDTSLLSKLKQHARNEGKVVRMMPELTHKAVDM